jgi:hypothetical protein
MEITKTCNKCNKAKTLDLFYANKKYELGVIGTCIECHKNRAKEWRASEHGQTIRKLYYNLKKETIIEKSKIYREKNKKEISNIKKEYRLANLDAMRSKSNNYYKNNKEKSLDANKQYRKNNPEKMKELAKKDYERSSQNLTDRYIRNIMKRHYGSVKEIPQEIIELKRIIIKTYRLCQQLQN